MVQAEYRDKKQVKNMNELVKEISKIGIVPVIVLNDAAKAVRTAKARFRRSTPVQRPVSSLR